MRLDKLSLLVRPSRRILKELRSFRQRVVRQRPTGQFANVIYPVLTKKKKKSHLLMFGMQS